jgi:hypothetical protein
MASSLAIQSRIQTQIQRPPWRMDKTPITHRPSSQIHVLSTWHRLQTYRLQPKTKNWLTPLLTHKLRKKRKHCLKEKSLTLPWCSVKAWGHASLSNKANHSIRLVKKRMCKWNSWRVVANSHCS